MKANIQFKRSEIVQSTRLDTHHGPYVGTPDSIVEVFDVVGETTIGVLTHDNGGWAVHDADFASVVEAVRSGEEPDWPVSSVVVEVEVEVEEDSAATDYSAYILPISRDPSHYGSVCTSEDAVAIAGRIGHLAAVEFPGIQIEMRAEIGPSVVRGPDPSVCDEIREWVKENWTNAL